MILILLDRLSIANNENTEGEINMAKLVAFYSRADENYFGTMPMAVYTFLESWIK